MKRFIPIHMLRVTVTAILTLGGCAHPPSEGETQASNLVSRTFLTRKESWYGAEWTPGTAKLRLIELHQVTSRVVAQPVIAADRLNGVSARYILTVEPRQWRTWSGRWSSWQQGTGDPGGLFTGLWPGRGTGYWSMRLERINGEWHMQNKTPIHDFVEDPALVASLLSQAGNNP